MYDNVVRQGWIDLLIQIRRALVRNSTRLNSRYRWPEEFWEHLCIADKRAVLIVDAEAMNDDGPFSIYSPEPPYVLHFDSTGKVEEHTRKMPVILREHLRGLAYSTENSLSRSLSVSSR